MEEVIWSGFTGLRKLGIDRGDGYGGITFTLVKAGVAMVESLGGDIFALETRLSAPLDCYDPWNYLSAGNS